MSNFIDEYENIAPMTREEMDELSEIWTFQALFPGCYEAGIKFGTPEFAMVLAGMMRELDKGDLLS